jgi:hypothetical protein
VTYVDESRTYLTLIDVEKHKTGQKTGHGGFKGVIDGTKPKRKNWPRTGHELVTGALPIIGISYNQANFPGVSELARLLKLNASLGPA